MSTHHTPPYLERALLPVLEDAARMFPCIILTGARQVGKSTLLKRLMPQGMRYASLDDFAVAESARRDPVGFLELQGCPLCLDEIQYVPELMRAIKLRVDADRHPGMYWMSGSQRFLLMQGVTESLAGRSAVLDLYTLSQREAAGAPPLLFNPATPAAIMKGAATCDMTELYRRIWRGGYPGYLCTPGMNRDLFFSSYVQTYIERDICALSQVGDKGAFMDLMRSAASRTGTQLVYSDLARDAGVSVPTAKRWVSMLETSGIISLLRAYSTTTTKRLTKSPVLHFTDTGLCAWLAEAESPEALMTDRRLSGHILESWVYGQLLRSCANSATPAHLCYFRDSNGAELNLLAEKAGTLYPIEIKRSLNPSAADLKGRRALPLGQKKEGQGIVFCPIQEPLPLGDNAIALPISAL